MTRRTVIGIALWALVGPGCSGSRPVDSGLASDGEQPITLDLQAYVGRLVTLSPVLAGDTLRMLFDTGGGETLLAPGLAPSCDPKGRSVGFRMSGERVEWPLCQGLTLSFSGEPITDAEFGVWDLMSLLPDDWPQLDGVISLETFRGRPITIDLAEQRIILETRASFDERTRDMLPVPARLANGTDGGHLTLFVRGTLSDSGETGWFLVDSGNLAGVRLGPHMATSGGADGVGVVVGDGLEVRAPGGPADIIYDGALSEEFLRHVVLSVDLGTGAVWVKQSGAGEEGPG